MPRSEPIHIDAGQGADIRKSGKGLGFLTTHAAVMAFRAMPEAMQKRARIEVRGTGTIYTADQVRRLRVRPHRG